MPYFEPQSREVDAPRRIEECPRNEEDEDDAAKNRMSAIGNFRGISKCKEQISTFLLASNQYFLTALHTTVDLDLRAADERIEKEPVSC